MSAQRLDALKRLMDRRGVTALLVTRREDVRYLTGFTGSAGMVLVPAGRPWFLTDFRYQLQARRETSGVRVLIQKKDWTAAVADAAQRSRAKTLWIDESAVTVETVKKLRKTGLAIKGCGDLVAELRQVKDGQELRSIMKAIQRAEESFRQLRRVLKTGVTERKLALTLEFLMREKGSRRAAFDIIVASGKNGAMPHASATDKRLRDGELVTIDFGAEAEGYYCDITRTLCVGRPTARQRELHDLVLRAQQNAIARVRPGVACKALDKAARDTIAKAGRGKEFGHATGHGVGLMVHEAPTVSSLSKATLQHGMVFTIEPGVYVPGWGGVRIEDMVLVTETGAKVLTSLPREL